LCLPVSIQVSTANGGAVDRGSDRGVQGGFQSV
jgi:hypothetical protein